MEGICGRMCDACTWKEQLDCPGCQDGPGRRFSGGCPIADCCREKGHTACVTCTFSTGCALRRRDMPQNRLWAVEAERERRARLDRNAPVLAKWLWLLFWLVIPSVFSNILTMDTVAGAFPTAGVVGNVLAFLISLAYGVLLWQLREAAGVMGHTKRNWGTLKEAVLSAIKRYLNRNNWTQNGISMHSGPPHS